MLNCERLYGTEPIFCWFFMVLCAVLVCRACAPRLSPERCNGLNWNYEPGNAIGPIARKARRVGRIERRIMLVQ